MTHAGATIDPAIVAAIIAGVSTLIGAAILALISIRSNSLEDLLDEIDKRLYENRYRTVRDIRSVLHDMFGDSTHRRRSYEKEDTNDQ